MTTLIDVVLGPVGVKHFAEQPGGHRHDGECEYCECERCEGSERPCASCAGDAADRAYDDARDRDCEQYHYRKENPRDPDEEEF